MKISITGALGHIGSQLIRELPLAFPNAEIILIDNLMTQRYASLFNLPSLGKFKFIELDVSKSNLYDILNGSEVVIHLAAITDAAGSFDKAKIVEENNLISTKNVANTCALLNAKLICISSTSVYGTQDKIVFEDCSIENLKPQSPYAECKLQEEALVLDLAKKNAINAVILRFGTIFGPSIGMRFHTAVNKFCWQSVFNTPLTIWKTAYEQQRPYLDLQDACNAIIHCIKANLFNSEIYNVLTFNATVKEIVDTISIYSDSLQLNFIDSPIMNQLSYEVDNNKFIRTGFNYGGNIRSGIGKTIQLLKDSNYKK